MILHQVILYQEIQDIWCKRIWTVKNWLENLKFEKNVSSQINNSYYSNCFKLFEYIWIFALNIFLFGLKNSFKY